MSEKRFLEYKEKPMVRNGNTIYYGNMADEYVVMLQIMSTRTEGELEIADKVVVQLMSTDADIKIKDRVIKKSEKKGLYNAIDVGAIWLERALRKQ